jgi:predicted phage tail protein
MDGLIERVEVLDGLRGDILDKAVTWRDLDESGFTIQNLGSGGSPQVTNTPGPGDGTATPVEGPASPPTSLSATDVWLAILLEWSVSGQNLQFVEVWRNTVDDLSTAVRLGTSRTSFYTDYVGAEASFYYWVRAVGTDGTYTAYYDPDPDTAIIEGVLGTTGVDPSDWEDNLNISADNLDALLASRIDLIDTPTTGLVDRMSVAEGDIVAIDNRTTTLESTTGTLQTDVSGNTALIGANATLISNQSTLITDLRSDLTTAEGDMRQLRRTLLLYWIYKLRSAHLILTAARHGSLLLILKVGALTTH